MYMSNVYTYLNFIPIVVYPGVYSGICSVLYIIL